MPPRAYWKGQVKLSLVAFPVRLYNAISSSSRVALNQLHAECNSRIKSKTTCPIHGEIPRSDLVKGYEFEKGKYVVIDDADLERIKLESNRTLELLQFIDADELQPKLLNTPYYVAPDGALGEEAFAVIREALQRTNKVGIGRVILSNREHVFALQPEDRGFCMTTLRYAQEIKSSTSYFEEIGKHEIDDDQLSLAEELIRKHSAVFEPEQFKDRYRDGLMEVIKAKIEGAEPVVEQQAEAGKVINLMDALKQSVKAKPGKKPPASSVKTTRAKKKSKGAG